MPPSVHPEPQSHVFSPRSCLNFSPIFNVYFITLQANWQMVVKEILHQWVNSRRASWHHRPELRQLYWRRGNQSGAPDTSRFNCGQEINKRRASRTTEDIKANGVNALKVRRLHGIVDNILVIAAKGFALSYGPNTHTLVSFGGIRWIHFRTITHFKINVICKAVMETDLELRLCVLIEAFCVCLVKINKINKAIQGSLGHEGLNY